MAIEVADRFRAARAAHGSRRPIGALAPAVVHRRLGTGSFHVSQDILRYETTSTAQFIDITDDVARRVAVADVAHGTVTVFSRHTTAAIKLSEHEPELLKDLKHVLASVAPETRAYFHNDFSVRTVNMVEDECPNGQAHCQHLLLGSSETIPLHDGRLMIGRWQRLFLIELDHGRTRDVAVTVMGC
jgi:secondary thiamine-phosphate synthase enzyme